MKLCFSLLGLTLALISPHTLRAQEPFDKFIYLDVSLKMIVNPATGSVPTTSVFRDGANNPLPLTTNDANLRQAFVLMNRWLAQTWRGYRVRLVDLVNPTSADPTFKRIGSLGDTTGPGKWFLSDLKNQDPDTVNAAFEVAAKANKAAFAWNDNAVNIYVNDGPWSRANFPWSGADNVITGYTLISFDGGPENYQTNNYKIAGNLLHELGHFYGLAHTFGGADTGLGDDGFTDTADDLGNQGGRNETVVRNALAQANWQQDYSALTSDRKTLVDNTVNNGMSYYQLFYDDPAQSKVLTDAERFGPTRFLFTELQMDTWADYANAGRKPGTSGSTRFVEASAGTGGTGTSLDPYHPLSNAITNASTLQKDILMLRPGTYTAATLNKPMTIRATRNGPAIIQKP